MGASLMTAMAVMSEAPMCLGLMTAMAVMREAPMCLPHIDWQSVGGKHMGGFPPDCHGNHEGPTWVGLCLPSVLREAVIGGAMTASLSTDGSHNPPMGYASHQY